MKEVIINEQMLNINTIKKSVVRVKAIIINNDKQILLIHNNGTFQFPGGHQEEGEDLKETLRREILEETGIDINISGDPFMEIKDYINDTCYKIYYYLVYCDLYPKLAQLKLDDLEKATPFKLFYVNFSDIKRFLKQELNKGEVDGFVCQEMLMAVAELTSLNSHSSEGIV